MMCAYLDAVETNDISLVADVWKLPDIGCEYTNENREVCFCNQRVYEDIIAQIIASPLSFPRSLPSDYYTEKIDIFGFFYAI